MAIGSTTRRLLLWCAAIAATLALLLLLLTDSEPHVAAPATGVLTRASIDTGERVVQLATQGAELSASPGHATGDTPQSGALDLAVAPSSAALSAGGVVRGRVADESRNAIAGAEIWLSDAGSRSTGAVVTVTDAQGRFELHDVLAGRRVAARARGFAESASHRVLERHARELLEIVVRTPCGRVLGRVHGAKDAPIAGARVVLGYDEGWELTEPPTDVVCSGPPQLQTVTDADGRYLFESVPPGRDFLKLRAAGFTPIEVSVSVRSTEDATVNVAMEPECVVQGLVTDGDGRPVAGADVSCAGERPPDILSRTSSDERGFYRLGELPAGNVAIDARHPEVGECHQDVSCKAGESATWNPVLVAGPLLKGVVLDRLGAPLARARVVFASNGNTLSQQETICDDEGRFETRLSPLRIEFRLVVTTEKGWLPVLELEEQLAWEGERVLVAGWAEAAANIVRGRLVRDGMASGPPPGVQLAFQDSIVNRGAFARPAEDGSFELRDLPDGRFTMVVRLGVLLVLSLPVEVAGGEVVDLGDLLLRAEVGSLTLRPRFIGFEPAPPDLVFLDVRLFWPDGSPFVWMLQRNSVFETDAALAGDYLLELKGEGIATSRTPVTVVAGRAMELTADVVPGKHVRLTSCSPSYPAKEDCTLIVLDSHGTAVSQRSARASKTGCMDTSACLAPGPYTLEVHVRSTLLHSTAFVVTEAPRQEISLNAP